MTRCDSNIEKKQLKDEGKIRCRSYIFSWENPSIPLGDFRETGPTHNNLITVISDIVQKCYCGDGFFFIAGLAPSGF